MPDLLQTQQALADWLLKPASDQVPGALAGIPEERLGIYRHLLRGTVESCLSGIYPQTKKAFTLLQKEPAWKSQVDHFRRQCPNVSYMLLYAVEQFPDYLAKTRGLPPWISELARYEWLETVVQNLPDTTPPENLTASFPQTPEALTCMRPVWNEARVLARFDWPVTRLVAALSSGELPDDMSPETQHLLIYRDPESFRARFFVLNPLTASLIAALAPGQSLGAGITELMTKTPALQQLPVETVTHEALGVLTQCLDQGIVLGSAPTAG